MKICKLCHTLVDSDLHAENQDMDNSDSKLQAHVQIHQRQLRMITLKEVSFQEMMGKCFPATNGQEVIKEEIVAEVDNSSTRRKGTCHKRNHPMSNICDEVFEKQGRKCSILCSVCGTLLKVMNGGYRESSKISNHACIHLDKDMFECRFCDYACATPGAIGFHLRRTHKLSGIKSNCIDHTSEHESDIIAMIKYCFGEGMTDAGSIVKQEKVAQAIGKIKPSDRGPKDNISKICHELYIKSGRKSLMTCADCGSSLKVKYKDKFISNRVKDHAYMHVGKDIFECRFCSYKGVSLSLVHQHLLKTHEQRAISENYLDHTIAHQADIINTIRRCFGGHQPFGDQQEQKNVDSDVKQAANTSHSKRRKINISMKRPIPKLCYEIYQTHGLKKAISCLECGATLIISSRGNFHNGRIVNHVHRHLGKDLFECRFCEYKCSNRGTIDHHLIIKHAVSAVDQNFINHTNAYEVDVLDMIKRCFENDRISTEQPKKVPKFSRTTPLSTFCRKLLMSNDENEKVACSECGKQIALFTKCRGGGIDVRIMYEHASIHLNIRPYHCALCDYHAFGRTVLSRHLEATHQRKYSDETFTNSLAQHEDEIKAMVMRCFGNDPSRP